MRPWRTEVRSVASARRSRPNLDGSSAAPAFNRCCNGMEPGAGLPPVKGFPFSPRRVYSQSCPPLRLTPSSAAGIRRSSTRSGGLSPPSAPPGLLQAVRSYDRFSQVLTDILNARIYGGMHYRNSTELGTELGRQVARQAIEHYFLPRRDD